MSSAFVYTFCYSIISPYDYIGWCVDELSNMMRAEVCRWSWSALNSSWPPLHGRKAAILSFRQARASSGPCSARHSPLAAQVQPFEFVRQGNEISATHDARYHVMATFDVPTYTATMTTTASSYAHVSQASQITRQELRNRLEHAKVFAYPQLRTHCLGEDFAQNAGFSPNSLTRLAEAVTDMPARCGRQTYGSSLSNRRRFDNKTLRFSVLAGERAALFHGSKGSNIDLHLRGDKRLRYPIAMSYTMPTGFHSHVYDLLYHEDLGNMNHLERRWLRSDDGTYTRGRGHPFNSSTDVEFDVGQFILKFQQQLPSDKRGHQFCFAFVEVSNMSFDVRCGNVRRIREVVASGLHGFFN